MKGLEKNWKGILAAILLVLTAYLYFNVYRIEKSNFEMESQQLRTIIQTKQTEIADNERYREMQDEITAAREAVKASRIDLYEHFPVELKEEDQILYVLYLESVFGTEIDFTFSEAEQIVPLSDGELQGMLIKVDYKTTYQGFQDMVDYLATDSRIVSVFDATINYYERQDLAVGELTLLLYLVNTDKVEYKAPEILNEPETGKQNIFAESSDKKKDIKTLSTSSMVWISSNGDKYHSKSDCSNMTSPRQVTLANAKKQNRTACAKCY